MTMQHLSADLVVLNRTEMSRERLYSLLCRLDNEYIPPISSQVDITRYAAKLTEHAVVIIAYNVDRDVGLIAFYANDLKSGDAFISSLGVEKSYRGSGLTKRLLTKAEAIAANHGMRRIKLEVSRTNTRAIQFYTREGFVPEHENKTSSSFIMVKTLAMAHG